MAVGILSALFDILLIQKESDDGGGNFRAALHLHFLAGPELPHGDSFDEGGDFRLRRALFFLPLTVFSFLSVYGALPSCTYIIEAIYNNGVIKDGFQFIKKANTERIMEETK